MEFYKKMINSLKFKRKMKGKIQSGILKWKISFKKIRMMMKKSKRKKKNQRKYI
jgi:hypothetical protein